MSGVPIKDTVNATARPIAVVTRLGVGEVREQEGVHGDVGDTVVVDDDGAVHGSEQGVDVIQTGFVKFNALEGVFPNFGRSPSQTIIGGVEQPEAVGQAT